MTCKVFLGIRPKQARLQAHKIVPDVAQRSFGDKNEQKKIDRKTPRRWEAMVDGKAAPTDPCNAGGVLWTVGCVLHTAPFRCLVLGRIVCFWLHISPLIDGLCRLSRYHPHMPRSSATYWPSQYCEMINPGTGIFTRSIRAGWPLTCAGYRWRASWLACILTEHAS